MHACRHTYIHTKLLYGMDTMQLPGRGINQLDVFHKKGFRQILHLQTTYANRLNTDARRFAMAAKIIGKPYRPLSHQYNTRKTKKLITILNLPDQHPMLVRTIDLATRKPPLLGKKRVGHPRDNWVIKTVEQYWLYVRRFVRPAYRYSTFNWKDSDHRAALLSAARNHLYKPGLDYPDFLDEQRIALARLSP